MIMKNGKKVILSCAAIVILAALVACAAPAEFPEDMYISSRVIEISSETIPLAEIPLLKAPAVSSMLVPVASGITVYSNGKAQIDASNIDDGYIMVCYQGTGTASLKVIATGPSGAGYTYNLNNKGDYEVFPLSDGNGAYKIGVYQNITGNRYSTLFTQSIDVKLNDEFAPFLLPNQYVNYTVESEVVKKAVELTKDAKTDLEKIEAVYNFVIDTLTYDKDKAASVASGYLPVVDDILKAKKGICFDYAAVMTAMLRSQGIPTKLVVGYTGEAYHAWINTYLEDKGWIEGEIYFDGEEWKLMDPTFASSGKSSDKIMEYIGDGKNYTAKYLY